MKKLRKFNSILAAAAFCAVSACATVATAQQISTDKPQLQQPSDTTTSAIEPQEVSKCSQLIGTPVKNQQGESLGKIADVVVSFHNERVSYCVLRVKHGIFTKTRFLAVPLAAFQPSEDGSHLILNANRANLANAGGFDRNQWPTATTPAWGAEPAAPQELPPVKVFAPSAAPAPTVGYPLVVDPAMYSPNSRQFQSACSAIDAMQFQVNVGYVQSGH